MTRTVLSYLQFEFIPFVYLKVLCIFSNKEVVSKPSDSTLYSIYPFPKQQILDSSKP